MRRRLLLLLALISAAHALPGCADLSYYVRAAHGQAELEERARPIQEVLADPATPDWLRAKLTSAEQIRDFAVRELGLPDGGSFRAYADLGRPYVVWNVFAAPEFSLEPRQWCFPVAGCVSYRGYFSAEEAGSLADTLRRQGEDVYVTGVRAYSTLGWFEDPILNTFVRDSDRELARLVIHEMAHRVVYVKDDSTFNESFATAVESEGVRRWLSAAGRSSEASALEKAEERGRAIRELVAEWKRRLAGIYQTPFPAEEKRESKRRSLEDFRAELRSRTGWAGPAAGGGWLSGELNNAFFASASTYTGQLPAFQELLRRSGGDLRRFYEEVRGLARLSKEKRSGRLEALRAALAESRDPPIVRKGGVP